MNNLTIISGGQTGVDQAALRAARACGLPTGGVAAKWWMTEDGPCHALMDFGLVECQRAGYPARTRDNVRRADAVLWVGDSGTPGGRLTLRLVREWQIPALVIDPVGSIQHCVAADWIMKTLPEGGFLLAAGNRESSAPGIGKEAEALLTRAFRLLVEDKP